MDQADTLRRMMLKRQISPQSGTGAGVLKTQSRGPKIMTVASGKGGVGKSCFSATIGTMLARSGHRVLLIDGDHGLANLDIILNVQPTATLDQVLEGEASIQEAVLGVEPNLWLIPAASGLVDFKNADLETRTRLLGVLEQCPWEMDFVIVDAGAGIGNNVLSLHHPQFESVVMLTPEPTSLTDAYGLIKLLRRQGIKQASVVVNQVTDGREGTQVFQRLKDVAAKFVDIQLEYLGHWQRDEKIKQAIIQRKILLDLDSGASSLPSLQLLVKRFQTKFSGQSDEKTMTGLAHVAPKNTGMFFRTLLGEVKA